MPKIYESFEEVEDDVRENAPKIVYKLRTWNTETHKILLRDQQLWFPHPFDLNDPLDTRPKYTYDKAEIESQEFYQKLLQGAPVKELGITTEDELKEVGMKQWEKIKKDPQAHLDANRNRAVLTRERYERIGVFSTTTKSTDIQTWNLYADNFAGYAVGFDTADLAKTLQCSIGVVQYSDDSFLYSFLGNRDEMDEYLYKTKQWEYENEFRFITFRIGYGIERQRKFPPEIVKEIILGHNLALEAEEEILDIILKQYPKAFTFKTSTAKDGSIIKSLLKP